MSSSHPTDNTAAEPPWPSPAYAWFVVGILFAASVFSFLDRQVIALMVEDIKADLSLNDFEIGLLQGPPFGIFYALMSIPIALAADQYNRRNIIVAGVSFWSLATAACGLAGSFWQLFMARVGVGVGEATLSPSAYSLISDYFQKKRLALALAVFSMGNLTGVGLAMVIGGAIFSYARSIDDLSLPLLGTLHPWQFTFIVIGLPGLLLALAIRLIREPVRRGRSVPADALGSNIAQLRAFGRFARGHLLTFTCLFGSFTLLVLLAYANFAWVPTFFVRTYGWTGGQAGATYGGIVAVFGTAGAFFGGWLSNRLAARGYMDAPFRTTLLCTLPLTPLAILSYALAPTGEWAALVLVPAQFCGAVPAGLAATAMMTITPNEMRAKIGSVYLFFSNIIGLTLGSTSVGFITHFIFQDEQMLRYSIAIVNCTAAPLGILLIWLGMKPYRASLLEAETRAAL